MIVCAWSPSFFPSFHSSNRALCSFSRRVFVCIDGKSKEEVELGIGVGLLLGARID